MFLLTQPKWCRYIAIASLTIPYHTLLLSVCSAFLTILNRYLQSNFPLVGVLSFRDLPGHLYEKFLKLAEVAFTDTKRQEVIFHTLPADLVHFGFLDAVSSLYGGGSVSYNFLHLTVQEFLAAYHISQLCGDARLTLLRECGSDSRWNIVWRFVAGLTEFKFFEGHLNSNLFVTQSSDDNVEVKCLFIQCLFEANIKMDRSKLFEVKNIEVVFIFPSPLDLYALGYCVANLTSDVSWNIRLENIDSIDNITNGLKTNYDISNNHDNINSLRIIFSDEVDIASLKHFPLCGIMNLYLDNADVSDLCNLLPSMTSLKRLSLINGTCQCGDVLLQQLYQTNVTSLDIQDTEDIARCSSALQPLIDPLTGTLKELGVSGFGEDDESLLDVVCVSSSMKSLMLSDPHNISSLTLLETNTQLTKLDILFDQAAVEAIAEVTVGILEYNKTLEHLILRDFELPGDVDAIRNIAQAVHRNSTLRSLEMITSEEMADYICKNILNLLNLEYHGNGDYAIPHYLCYMVNTNARPMF